VAAADQAVRLLRFLSASESRSGEEIAVSLGCSRTAVWKVVELLRGMGVPLSAVPGKGYRLLEPLELLDAQRIEHGLPPGQRQLLDSLIVLNSVDSTNSEVKRMAAGSRHAVAVLAEQQTAGRGRHGRDWFSPLARNIYLSLGWRFETGIGELSPLPLLVALAASVALAENGLEGHVIKWPNDLLVGHRKLGGCLVEVQGDAGGPCQAVLGIGLNVHMPAETQGAEHIDQPWVDVRRHVPQISRNRLAASLVSALLDHLVRFERQGFEAFRNGWESSDWLAGQEVAVSHPGGTVRGVAQGVSSRGGLLVDTAEGRRELHAGEVSLRG
jgi:BirA family biotin operon repressor/biotin-[acetyl-CoA-carboxylase] ligase